MLRALTLGKLAGNPSLKLKLVGTVNQAYSAGTARIKTKPITNGFLDILNDAALQKTEFLYIFTGFTKDLLRNILGPITAAMAGSKVSSAQTVKITPIKRTGPQLCKPEINANVPRLEATVSPLTRMAGPALPVAMRSASSFSKPFLNSSRYLCNRNTR